jgi:transcriptional regulator with XRE-family HTH domain
MSGMVKKTSPKAATVGRPIGPTKNVVAAKSERGSAPDVGAVLKRLRLQRQLSIRDVADGCGISQSFLSMVERGDSDISLGRLSKLADFFEHDIGSLLGYSTRLSKPHFITHFERTLIDRGPGINYEVILLPGLEIELNVMTLNPKSVFIDAISHEGFDVLYVVKGDVVLCVADDEYPMQVGQCVYYSAAFRHRLMNRSGKPALVLGITTGRMS